MSDWIIGLVRSGGYAGIVFLMIVENIFPPIPSELIMPLAGYLAASDSLVLWAAIAAGTLGSVVGAVALYYVGKRVGSERLKRFADRHGCWMALSRSDIERSEHWFERRGIFAVFVCRLVPGIRSMISVPAGIARMNLGLFLIATHGGLGDVDRDPRVRRLLAWPQFRSHRAVDRLGDVCGDCAACRLVSSTRLAQLPSTARSASLSVTAERESPKEKATRRAPPSSRGARVRSMARFAAPSTFENQ
jgi:membrane protein DedA with SNARE-associated domain